jgi:hypothetical protein
MENPSVPHSASSAICAIFAEAEMPSQRARRPICAIIPTPPPIVAARTCATLERSSGAAAYQGLGFSRGDGEL